MDDSPEISLVRRRFLEAHGASVRPAFGSYVHVTRAERPRAALGYCRAGSEPLFLERYLDAPVEQAVSAATGRPAARESIIEIGNLAADDAFAMIELWGSVANDLGAGCEIAVATLTAPLRAMFARIGVPLVVLGSAVAERADDPEAWGHYYARDPQVCAGVIAQGQQAIAAFLARRRRSAA
ncbi:thermostable hemolysin [Novosphingobium mangrovi (ex Huang et al. 2023)]|uniref:Thermostable hemolysin n=1 Tax=Novosphingobium mangrovi (ex Huang et al. 2023) TaxID=2976432 RepID=A0ABT2I074_9SPHN|nr:thermostable hemolysin [Novosphingobium mangrovi (ex Huang et al. 2023)]MCT2398201.1 thermostable hemolysin [Novosphingobium mangrovi (ex Huang et al. 2023)]